ncbi:hypothetical protein FACS1894190_16810 [Spirochaetia bacterium]|nr:hypothetical protein FACS1894190_16810 [Spirochaetia bacterium]
MPYYLLTKYNNTYSKLLAGIMLVVAVFQIEVSVQMQYSDYARYNDEIHSVYDIDRMIRDEQDDAHSLPVAIIGQFITRQRFNPNRLRGEILGDSLLREFTVPFFKTLGINWMEANEEQINEARIYSENMSAYPYKGCVKRYNDIIVIKLSE